MSRKIAYTAVFGGYDTPRTPTVKSKGWRYLLFTDQDIQVDGWETVLMPSPGIGRDNIFMARWMKIMFHNFLKDFDICLWTDANIQITCDLNEFIKNNRNEFVTMEHPTRKSVYEEAKACLHKGEQTLIKQQMDRYTEEEYFADNGLVSSGILLRRPTEAVKDFCDKWFYQVDRFSIRDQLSFNYVLWKNPIDLKTIPYNVMMAKDFNIVPHKKKK